MTSPGPEQSLAEGLDRALRHRAPAPGLADDEVADLVRLAETLEASTSHVVPDAEFRAAARRRLLVHMARSAPTTRKHWAPMDRVRLWAARCAAGVTALSLAGAAAASASASALPGDALYPVKQATEAVAVQLATTEMARQDLLLHQADTRLDETVRLVEQGRDADAALAVARYDETVARLDSADASSDPETLQSDMRTNELRLSELLLTAPAPARKGLERALAATERSLARPRAARRVPIAADEPAVTASSEQRQAEAAEDRAPTEIETPRPADASERGAGESHASAPVAPRGQGVEHRPAATPVEAEADTAAVDGPDSNRRGPAVGSSSGEPRGIAPARGDRRLRRP
jgi:hypothetical protein